MWKCHLLTIEEQDAPGVAWPNFSWYGGGPPNVPTKERFTTCNIYARASASSFQVSKYLLHLHTHAIDREFSIARDDWDATPCLIKAPSSTDYCETSERSCTKIMTSCLSSAPPSTGGFTQVHRLWTTWNWSVLMGSVCVELTLSPYVALMLRADITQMERRLHTAQPIYNTCIHGIYNHHGTPTLFLTNFTKTVKLTKTPITCHYRGWNSFSCDHLQNHENYWKVDFQINIFGDAC